MCSIFGNMSVPSGSVGFGREPGRRNTFGMVDGGVEVGGAEVAAGPLVVLGPVVDFDDDEQLAIAAPAPASAIPFSIVRRLSESIPLVYRARRRRARRVSASGGRLRDELGDADAE